MPATATPTPAATAASATAAAIAEADASPAESILQEGLDAEERLLMATLRKGSPQAAADPATAPAAAGEPDTTAEPTSDLRHPTASDTDATADPTSDLRHPTASDDDTPPEDQIARQGELDAWATDLPAEAQEKIRAKNKSFVTRIDQLKSQRDTAREAREDAKTELELIKAKANEALKGPVALTPTPQNPLSHVRTAAQLKAELRTAQETIEWCEENADGATVADYKGNPVEWTAAQVAKLKGRQEAVVNRHGPAREQYLRLHAAAGEAARTIYPEVFDAKTESGKLATQLLQEVPELANAADHELLLGHLSRGFQVWADSTNDKRTPKAFRVGNFEWVPVDLRKGTGRAAAPAAVPGASPGTSPKPAATAAAPSATPAAAAKPAPKPALSAAASTPPAQSGKGSKPDTSALRKRALETGSDDAVAALLAAKLG